MSLERGPKPAGYGHLTWATIDCIAASCSTPASRAGIACKCRQGDDEQRRLCKDQPQCNLKANPSEEHQT